MSALTVRVCRMWCLLKVKPVHLFDTYVYYNFVQLLLNIFNIVVVKYKQYVSFIFPRATRYNLTSFFLHNLQVEIKKITKNR